MCERSCHVSAFARGHVARSREWRVVGQRARRRRADAAKAERENTCDDDAEKERTLHGSSGKSAATAWGRSITRAVAAIASLPIAAW
jgi:hypothetical protein